MYNSYSKPGTERLRKSISDYNTENSIPGLKALSLPAKHPYLENKSISGHSKPIQLLDITTHGSGNAMRSGGGQGSGIKTGDEVRAIIRSNNGRDIHHAIQVLKTSIKNREEHSHLFDTVEQNHAQRIVDEKRWLSNLEDAERGLHTNHSRSLHQTMFGGPIAVTSVHHGATAARQGDANDARFTRL